MPRRPRRPRRPRPRRPADRPPRAVLLLATATVVLTVAACSAGAGDRSLARWETVVDTVGDTVVVRTVGASDEAARLALVPELQIGEFEGDDAYQFADVGFVAPTADGGAYVWDRTLTVLRRYDSTGTFVRQVGAKGGGPGEYEAANGLALLPDGRLALWDPRNTRVTLYDTAGAPAASWRSPSALFVGGPNGMAADTAGNLYLMHWFRVPGREDALPGENTGYMVLGPDGAVRDSVFPPRLPAPDTRLVAQREGSTNVNSVPFAPGASWAFSPFGYYVAGVSDRYAVTLARAGAPLRVEREVAPVPVDPDERANVEERTTANMRSLDPSWRWNGPPIPDHKPAFRSLLVGADGRLWVQRSMPGERIEPDTGAGGGPSRLPPRRWREPVAYDVFEADGRYVGFVPLPASTTLLHLRGDRVWGVTRDSLDVPYVTRFRLEPAAGR